jgi:uncharacterized membrane-anchored protein
MRSLRIIIFTIVALIQLSVPASVVWRRAQTLKHGRLWKFKTAPADPVDAVRGRYIALRFAAEEVPQVEQPIATASVYAVLKEDENGFAKVEHISTARIVGDDAIKAEPLGYWRDSQHVRFPFNRYWVTEANAPAAEKAYLDNSRRGNQNAYVTVRVHNGDAEIEQLYIDNQRLADYLRAHPAH